MINLLFIESNPGLKIAFFVVVGLLVIGLCVVIYFCIKNPDFRQKTFGVSEKIILAISKVGEGIIKNYGKRSTETKVRKPMPDDVKNKVYVIAGDKCQICGKIGNLKFVTLMAILLIISSRILFCCVEIIMTMQIKELFLVGV